MALIIKTTATEFLMEGLNHAIRRMAESVYEEAKQEMIKKLEDGKDEYIAGLVLKFTRAISIDDYVNHIKITVEKKDLVK